MKGKRCSWRAAWPVAAFVLFGFLSSCADGFLLDQDVFNYRAAVDLDKDYDWYASQADTGPASGNNCGPASVAMAVEYRQARELKVEDVRNLFPAKKGWWKLSDVKKALDHHGVSYAANQIAFKEQLFNALSDGRLLLVTLNMSLVTREQDGSESRYNRFYGEVTGHFVVLKGYSADKRWFIAYDSNSWGNDRYPDQTPKGKNRLYSADEVTHAMQKWNPCYLEI